MPIRLLPDGIYEFDTVEEAMQFRALSLAHNGSVEQRHTPPATMHRTPPRADFDGFFNDLETHQEVLLRCIAQASGVLTTENLAQQTGLEPGQVGPMLRHVRSKAQRYRIDPDRLVESRKDRPAAGERAARVYSTLYRDEINSHLPKQ